MPIYVYRCPVCGDVAEIVQRSNERVAPPCLAHPTPTWMEPVTATANFTIKGYSAKNGYSK